SMAGPPVIEPLRASAVSFYLRSSVWSAAFARLPHPGDAGTELTERSHAAQGGSLADLVFVHRCRWSFFPNLARTLEGARPADMLPPLRALHRALGMSSISWDAAALEALDARVAPLLVRVPMSAPVSQRVDALCQALTPSTSGDTTGAVSDRALAPGSALRAEVQFLCQSSQFQDVAARVADSPGSAALGPVFDAVRSGLTIFRYCFYRQTASRLSPLHSVFSKLATLHVHMPLYLGQALTAGAVAGSRYTVVAHFQLSEAVVHRVLNGDFVGIYTDFDALLYQPLFSAIHGERVPAEVDPVRWLSAAQRLLSDLFVAVGFDSNGPLALSTILQTSISIVQSAPRAMQATYLARIKAVLLHGFHAATARYREFLADISTTSLGTVPTLFIDADGILEQLQQVETLVFTTAMQRLSPTPAPAPSSTTSRARSSAPTPPSSATPPATKKAKVAVSPQRVPGTPFSGTLTLADNSTLDVRAVTNPDTGDIVGSSDEYFCRYIRVNKSNAEKLYVQSVSALSKAAGVDKCALCWPVVGSRSRRADIRFRSCPNNLEQGHMSPTDTRHVQPSHLLAELFRDDDLAGQEFAIPL
ncbi:MAG: hypothetical protein AAGK22_28890, partial [Acidobacteriota bacterium]